MKNFILEKLVNNTEKTYIIIKENNNEDNVREILQIFIK